MPSRRSGVQASSCGDPAVAQQPDDGRGGHDGNQRVPATEQPRRRVVGEQEQPDEQPQPAAGQHVATPVRSRSCQRPLRCHTASSTPTNSSGMRSTVLNSSDGCQSVTTFDQHDRHDHAERGAP